MKFLLDTNICIYARVRCRHRFRHSVTAAELAFGVAKSRSAKNRVALETFLLPLNVAPFDLAAAFAYGELRAELEHRGQPIGPLDLKIAAHAISLGTILITNNEREFRRVPSLKVQNWA